MFAYFQVALGWPGSGNIGALCLGGYGTMQISYICYQTSIVIWWHCNIELCKQDLQTCDRTDKAWWPPDLWSFSKLVPLSLTSSGYLLSDLPVWTHNVHPSLRFQQQLFTAFPLKSPAACLRLATDCRVAEPVIGWNSKQRKLAEISWKDEFAKNCHYKLKETKHWKKLCIFYGISRITNISISPCL